MHKLFAIAVFGCCFASASLYASDDEPITSVQDLRYGVVLYDFFQDDYFQALTELLLGEQQQDMPHHAEFAQLLRGGISLSYGMDTQARDIFEQLLAQHPKPAVRDRAWFYLGKNYYERGDTDNAAMMLNRVGANLPPNLAQERDYLRANLALQRGDLASATLPASAGDKLNPWLPYLLFNRGVLQSTQGDAHAAANSFEQLVALPLREEEHKALRDRAFTASGFTYLGAQQPQAALTAFKQVRLNSPFADKALLGYGWAAAQLSDFKLALQPWQELNQRSLLLPAVQEGLLAVPYAYEQLGAAAQALEEYQHAEQLYVQETARIDAAIDMLQKTSLLSLWLDPKAKEAWLSRHEELPVTPQLPYLEHLLALNSIQEILKDMRDLGVLEQYLTDWRDRLSALDAAQALQYQRRQQALQARPDKTLYARYDALQQQRDQLAAQLDKAQQTGDGSLLMEAQDLTVWKRLERVRALIEALRKNGQDVSAAEQKYQRYRGLLAWQLQENYPARRWAMTKTLRQLDTQLALAQLDKASVANLVERANAPEQGPRIRALDERLQKILGNIHNAQAQGDGVLRARAIAELQTQRERLVAYLGRAKLAKARLLDKGTTEALQ
ncbi:MAG TPA: tetratricopeptide repeat protein [Spongiibacteraceae bacterium]